jgi:hypothetical protein
MRLAGKIRMDLSDNSNNVEAGLSADPSSGRPAARPCFIPQARASTNVALFCYQNNCGFAM